MNREAAAPRFHITEEAANGHVIRVEGDLTVFTAAESLEELLNALKKKSPPFSFDLAGIARLDDYGALVLFEVKHLLKIPKEQFHVRNAPRTYKKTLALADFDFDESCSVLEGRRKNGFIADIGASTIEAFSFLRFMITFVGGVAIALAHLLQQPRSLRANDTVTHMKTTGVDALPVVALISFLLGLIIAFLSSLQLGSFGANIFIPALVAMAMVSELGPIMTAIVVSGRTGSSYAAEIATMKISEEIDALVSMGFDPTLFLVIPRMIAALITIPLLTVFANFFGIAGGMMIGVTMLNLTAGAYISQTIETLTIFELGWGLMKSVIFALLIAGIGCLKGFQASGGAAAVGRAATSAVVASIFFIILVDSLFAIVRSYIG